MFDVLFVLLFSCIVVEVHEIFTTIICDKLEVALAKVSIWKPCNINFAVMEIINYILAACSSWQQRYYQNSASVAVWEGTPDITGSPHKGLLTRKEISCNDAIMVSRRFDFTSSDTNGRFIDIVKTNFIDVCAYASILMCVSIDKVLISIPWAFPSYWGHQS